MHKHSTFGEALEVSASMRAEYTLLTHFSSRYGKMGPVDEIDDGANVAVAFDFMEVGADQLATLAEMRPALVAIFKERAEANETQRENRIFKKLR